MVRLMTGWWCGGLAVGETGVTENSATAEYALWTYLAYGVRTLGRGTAPWRSRGVPIHIP